ncbi:hypothetical protein FHL15_003463 [Xylaria flabelliformis]|uniref:Trichothecene 3-O-acetyltransferase-like N-terminal domain-containing protein n=1 Tax=Xylaria flabelliformis TaxID=2512241 RepID=A0A553I5N3_9PEZI|nr:hypothetical protein FHL15_003463 [Xylaria flabelliformis]
MAVPALLPDPIRLSPLEGFMPHAYVRQIYCFPTSSPSAISTLSQGLIGLAQDVPYILSRVVSNKSGTGSAVAVSTQYHSPDDIFSWNDLSASIDYATLKAGHFSPRAFLAPGIIPLGSVPPYPASPAVFLARASLVKGGLILCVAVYHVVVDITGFDVLLKIWASHCRDGSSREIGFNPSWMDRSPLFYASENPSNPPAHASIPKLLHIRTPEELAGRSQAGKVAGSGQKNYQTGIFYFPHQQLRVFKDAANAHITSQEPGSWVSTSDILSSLLWGAIIEVEGNSGPLDTNENEVDTDKDTRTSTLSFPVQFRSVLCKLLPRDFLGAAFLMTNAKVLHRDVCRISHIGTDSEPGTRDQKLKPMLQAWKSVHGIDDVVVRQVLSYLEAHTDMNAEASLILGPPRYDVGGSAASVVSWADQRVYELNWGDAIGRCDTVRLPKMSYQRDPIVLPRVPSLDGDDGGLEVIMSYEESIMRKLIEGPIMRRFAKLRCLS